MTLEERRAQWERGLIVIEVGGKPKNGRVWVLLKNRGFDKYHLHRYFNLSGADDAWECSADAQRKTAEEMLSILVKELTR